MNITNLSSPLSNFLRPDFQSRATQGNQLHQIADGVRSGSLTEREAQGLLKEQEAISNYQKSAMADGRLSLGERIHLAVMQGQAQGHISSARGNFERDFFAGFDSQAQRQAGQIDQIANGRANNTITNSEAGKLLGQQADIASTLGSSNPWVKHLLGDLQQAAAQSDITRHSRPGTQIDFQPFRVGVGGLGGF
jgi:hypothetical protein